jgi:CubicO group peptidase (beta-lactamase class C family)
MEKDFEDAWSGLFAGFGYGNYLRIMRNPGRAPFLSSEGEHGWDGLLGVHFANFPKEKITFIFMTQRSASGTLSVTRKLRNAILAAI